MRLEVHEPDQIAHSIGRVTRAALKPSRLTRGSDLRLATPYAGMYCAWEGETNETDKAARVPLTAFAAKLTDSARARPSRVPLVHARILAVVCLTLLASALSGCVEGDECARGESRCDGSVAMNCEPIETGDGTFNRWSAQTCSANTCKLDPAGSAFCATSTDPNPRCDGTAESFCDGTMLLTCRGSYAFSEGHDCASTSDGPFCVEVGPPSNSAFCATEPTRNPSCPNPSITPDGSTCDGNDFVYCSHRFVISRRSCGDLMCFTTVGETACR